ncbi:hypothetical protein [Planktothrix mougeotii]|uniref:Uncharacterized protein n=1 Tax=Planktothrix mougeotii LEGE 06226 TaxID=1828728 RepID=A0ABR9UFI7_9CYAN|nr:hypothetical protein [Planktothrix mougeotii]MBE9145230.1 hypothetical protein [Planktothrix mougeotii LEGE 06226]
MALSDYEKQQVIEELDILEETTRRVILASLEAFTEWLANVLYVIYLKIKDVVSRFWNWLRSQF